MKKEVQEKAEQKAALRLYPEDVKALEKLRARWKVRKDSEVIRRALHHAVASAN